ncbi:DNA-binding FadR family transcriptional regulator [Litorimonas taeanensis]|uniref:DNA-binding FadR family transcriptional regulator n=1 Tax=Litorimonas taeanensis TaxID=568099 RepID=A0A420WLU6_9PROT|nr:FadR/GntR family transcriptional regulator [Litorimonas taeanensis]RKQ71892.1 DNA-binding FadR family transcriptional regulator [Litorimonas taeanensis]
MAEQRLYHKVANQILELIDSGVFPPGSRLPGERDLAEKFGVSRVAVREAEISLQAQGRIEVRVGSGAYVLDGSEYTAHGLPKVGPFELTEARALFEAESAALAAPIITDESIAELERLIQIMMGTVSSEMTADEADEAFHLEIAKATNNPAIIFVIGSMWNMRKEAAQLQKVYRSVCHKDPSHREDEHKDILNALKNRDSSAARIAMRAHFTRMIEALLVASEEEAYQAVKKKTSESRSRFLITAQLT